MFSSVLVANRGEIALRVMRTCRRLGIRTVAVFSDADARAPHVRAADRAVRLGPAPAVESYLRGDLVIRAALETGAEAIHPGYGFLAENADVAEAVLEAGLAWVGPPPEAMRALGDKARGRALAEANGVPVVPGWGGDASDPVAAREAAAGLGYPLLVKASAGGGGRGMRVVRGPEDLDEALAAARREAEAAFGDGRLLLERHLERPRHVEVQVLGDAHGTLVHLGERECSIQRRHQKLVEESPSPAVDGALRTAMGEAALRLGRAAGYRSAGTVEFLLDAASRFHFLEVNARLQVEHPVTEVLTGLDLVEQQLRIAAGERLGFGQADVRLEGHAIEVRLVAEDPAAGFLPAAGRITALELPAGIRVDAGVAAGSAVPPDYDSLLAKLVAHGADRDEAVDRLAAALEATRLEGVTSNLRLLQAVLDEPAFRAGRLHTGFLEEHRLVQRLGELPSAAVAAAAALRSLARGPLAPGRPWRQAGIGEPSRWSAGGRPVDAVVDRGAGPDRATVRVAGVELECRLLGEDAGGWGVEVSAPSGGRAPNWIARVRPGSSGSADLVELDGRLHRLRLVAPPGAEAGTSGSDQPDALSAPMPGRIVRVHVEAGDAVRAGEPLVVLEAMKMEHLVAAAAPGRVAVVHVSVGDRVARGAPLVDLEARGAEDGQ